jgi:hypothetical protein
VIAGLPRPGAPYRRAQTVAVRSRIVAEVRPAAIPADFDQAVRSLARAPLRPEVHIEQMRAPQRLAPWTHALGLEVLHNRLAVATGRLVVLHDPEGYEAWQGTFRLVGYASVDLEPELAADPLLADVTWSWLVDALRQRSAPYVTAGGTVTQTTSTRFGEPTADSADATQSGLELRVSWTPLKPDLGPHLLAWADLLCTAAGLPPPGVTALPGRPD